MSCAGLMDDGGCGGVGVRYFIFFFDKILFRSFAIVVVKHKLYTQYPTKKVSNSVLSILYRRSKTKFKVDF